MKSAKNFLYGGLIALLLSSQSVNPSIPSKKEPSAKITKERMREEELQVFLSKKPKIYAMRMHHLYDKNGDGKYIEKEELIRVYGETVPDRIEVKDPIPGEGAVGFWVPQERFIGGKILTRLMDTTGGRNEVLDIRKVGDLTEPSTNNYPEKPQPVGVVELNRFRSQLEELNHPNKPGVHNYEIVVVRYDGDGTKETDKATILYAARFSVDYSKRFAFNEQVKTNVTEIKKP